jgi:hypothetical protein
MKKDYSGFYHESCLDYSIFHYWPDTSLSPINIDWNGPYRKWSDCKKDAIEYHQIDISTARQAIYTIKNTKKPEMLRRKK